MPPTSGRPRALDPLAGRGRITSRYGPRTHPITGEKNKEHEGVDWGAPTGTPVYAAVGGLVERVDTANDGKRDANGNAVVIRTTAGDRWLYLHLDSVSVGQGQSVTAGDQLGTVGTTGRSTGPHLHLQVYVDGKTVDPLSFFA